MAKTPKAKVDRSPKLAELNEIVQTTAESREQLNDLTSQRELLLSVAHGLYEETDKLSKKAPAEQITDLLLEQVNQVIGETKELIAEDPYVQRMKPFVAAGDNPEHRDVVVVLRMVLQALERFRKYIEDERPTRNKAWREAVVLQHATAEYVRSGAVLTKGHIKSEYTRHAEDWFLDVTDAFDFERLDETSLKEYFDIE